MSVNFVLVRHGETEWNVQRRWQGQGGEGLNARGRDQAEILARRLAQEFRGPDGPGGPHAKGVDGSDAEGSGLGPAPMSPPRIIASDLQRCADTAAAVAAAVGVSFSEDSRLREIDVGTWSGLTHAEVAAADPDGGQPWQLATNVALGGAESVEDVRDRIASLLADVSDLAASSRARGEDPPTTIAITHGGVIRIGTAMLLGMPRVEPLQGCANASITRWHCTEDGAWQLAAYNSTEHLGIGPAAPAVTETRGSPGRTSP